MRISPGWILSLLVLPALAGAAAAQQCQVTMAWEWPYQEPLPAWNLSLTRTLRQQTTQETRQLETLDAASCQRSLPPAEQAGFDPTQTWCAHVGVTAGAYTVLLQANESIPDMGGVLTFGVRASCQVIPYDEAMRMDDPGTPSPTAEPESAPPAPAEPPPEGETRKPLGSAPPPEVVTRKPLGSDPTPDGGLREPRQGDMTPDVFPREARQGEAPLPDTPAPLARTVPRATTPPASGVPPEAATEDDDPAVMLTQLLERVAPILEGFATAEQVYHETLARITADYKAALHTLRSESQLWEAYRRALDRQMDAYAQIQQTWAGLLQRYQAVLLTLPSPGQAQR